MRAVVSTISPRPRRRKPAKPQKASRSFSAFHRTIRRSASISISCAAPAPDRYPGSPWLAAHLLRPQDRLIAIEKHPGDFPALRAALAPFARAKAEESDGYARLPALLPPPERRGLVLIDPPFEAEDEFERAAQTFAKAHARFATGHYLLWYPVKSRAGADAFANEVLAAGPRTALRLEIARLAGTRRHAPRRGRACRRQSAFGFAEQMTDMAPKLERALAGPAHLRMAARRSLAKSSR